MGKCGTLERTKGRVQLVFCFFEKNIFVLKEKDLFF